MKWTSVLILASAVLSSSYASEDEATAAFKRAISENTAAAYWASLEKFPDNKLTDSTNAEALSALESGQLIDAERLLQTATSTDATEQQQAERARLTQRLRRQISQLVVERERLIAEQDAHFRRELTATTRKLVQGQYHAANATPDGYIWVGSMPAGASVYIAS